MIRPLISFLQSKTKRGHCFPPFPSVRSLGTEPTSTVHTSRIQRSSAPLIRTRIFSRRRRNDEGSGSSATLTGRDGVPREDMPFFHHRNNSKPMPKFKIPRKRASKLFHELKVEAVKKHKESNRSVHNVPFRVGDAIEVTQIAQGGVDSTDLETIRGVVLGIRKRGLGTGVYIRDVLYGEPVEWKIQLFSPLIKSIKVLEENFVRKGKKKVKRAKLYYLRDRNPNEYRVTKV